AIDDGLAGPFHKGLPQEDGSIPAPMDPELAATLFLHGSQPRIFLKAGSIRVAVPAIAEGDQQAGRQLRSRTRQFPEEGAFGMGGKLLGYARIELGDMPLER